MFDRAYVDLTFIKRWSITRNLRDQSVAEHTFLVAMYTNDICTMFGLGPEYQLPALQYALWHDMDEVITGDMPGPNKRMLVSDRGQWKKQVNVASNRVFGEDRLDRSGKASPDIAAVVLQIVKVADWLEAAVNDGTEMQMGNLTREAHYIHDSEMCLQEAKKLLVMMESVVDRPLMPFLENSLERAIHFARYGQSPGPVLADEMQKALKKRDENNLFRMGMGCA